MKLKAYGTNLTQEDRTIISQMMGFLLKEVPNQDYEIIDTLSFDPEIEPEDIIFTFGSRARILCKKYPAKLQIDFPEASKLHKTAGNEDSRYEAHAKLIQIKNQITSQTIEERLIKEAQKLDLPKIPREDLLKLALLENKSWQGVTRSGRSIKITTKPEPSTTDISITIPELYYLDLAIQAFDIKEIQVVNTNIRNNNKPNSK